MRAEAQSEALVEEPRALRVEDVPFLTGRGKYGGDFGRKELAMMVVRSTVAHGVLRGVDVVAAKQAPGVVAVLTAEDIVGQLGAVPRIPLRLSGDGVSEDYLQPVLAHERIRYVGEPLAIVVAENRYLAEDAADLVFADIEPLPAVAVTEFPAGGPPPGAEVVKELRVRMGDPDAVFATAPVVVEAELAVQRHTAVPMETRSLFAEYRKPSGVIALHGVTKVPHWNREQIERDLNLGPGKLVMLEANAGGGFGARGEYYPEDFLVVWAASALQRSVGWVEDRQEHFLATNHSREQKHVCALAGDEHGRILGMRTEFCVDLGAYVRTNGMRVPENTLSWIQGPYDIPAYEGVGYAVSTHRTPTGTYRAPGGVEATFVRERLIEMYAARIGRDPIDVRRENLVTPEQMPHERPLLEGEPPIRMDEGDYPRLFDAVLARIDRAAIARRRQGGERVGLGVGLFLEKSGTGPFESGAVEIAEDGTVHVRSGCSSVGQGVRTMLAQVVARVLDIDHMLVEVEPLDTDKTPRGVGSFASRSTVMGGSAVHVAAGELVKTARALAAKQLGVKPAALVVHDGGLRMANAPHRWISFAEISAALRARDDGGEGLKGEAIYEFGPVTHFNFGAHAAIVSIDEELGTVKLEHLVVGFDVGNAINPMIVEGQLIGGAAQGVGGALLEHLVFDDEGNPVTTSFMDYLLPTACEIPSVELVLDASTPTASNPLGVKGAGEGGITGIPAAIAGAVCDALASPGFVDHLPIDLELVQRMVSGALAGASSTARPSREAGLRVVDGAGPAT
jgi:carbon-monoxide dehydrogenase large subunit